MTIEVIKPGLLTTLQDTGRPGYAHLGVGRSGAFDVPALRLANALCGNARNACGLEITLLGPTLCFHASARIAVTGAPLLLRIDTAKAPMWAPLCIPAGATVSLGSMRTGCRAYLAVVGGLDAELVLGSCSTDVNAALGPSGGRPLHAGDILHIAAAENPGAPHVHGSMHWRLDSSPWYDDLAKSTLRIMPGTHLESLTEMSRRHLFSQSFLVSTDSNRVGVRLLGPGLEWTRPSEMISEGSVPGMLQLPPLGQPIAFGPECPVNGGYPRLGQIAAADLPHLAQLRPGDAVRFEPCAFEDALAALGKRERALQRLEASIHARLHLDSGFHRDASAVAPE